MGQGRQKRAKKERGRDRGGGGLKERGERNNNEKVSKKGGERE